MKWVCCSLVLRVTSEVSKASSSVAGTFLFVVHVVAYVEVKCPTAAQEGRIACPSEARLSDTYLVDAAALDDVGAVNVLELEVPT